MSSKFRMVDVGPKEVTHRVAVASGKIEISKEVIKSIKDKTVPKGDVLALAEVAGIVATKKTSDILPLCHPLVIDAVEINCQLDEEAGCVVVECRVETRGRTGVEMEALSGVSAALLCIYDLTKSLDKGTVISEIRLESKAGGKSGEWSRSDQTRSSAAPIEPPPAAFSGLRSAVITASDTRAKASDKSGALLVDYLSSAGAEIISATILPDEMEKLREEVLRLVKGEQADLIIITGGTGIGPRDVTPEALAPLWTKVFTGFGELFRSAGMKNTPYAWLSRAAAGLVEGSVVILLPGSPSGVADGISILRKNLPHMLAMIRGEGH